MIGDMRPGDRADFVLIRDSQKISVIVEIKKRAEEEEVKKMNSEAWPGLSVFPLVEGLRERLKIEETIQGVFIAEVYPKTTMQVAGLQSGDIITGINGKNISSLPEFYQAIAAIGNDKFFVNFIREGHEMESPKIKKK